MGNPDGILPPLPPCQAPVTLFKASVRVARARLCPCFNSRCAERASRAGECQSAESPPPLHLEGCHCEEARRLGSSGLLLQSGRLQRPKEAPCRPTASKQTFAQPQRSASMPTALRPLAIVCPALESCKTGTHLPPQSCKAWVGVGTLLRGGLGVQALTLILILASSLLSPSLPRTDRFPCWGPLGFPFSCTCAKCFCLTHNRGPVVPPLLQLEPGGRKERRPPPTILYR